MRHLSNTAVPKYYARFKEKVMRGEIPVNKEIMMEMNRIDDLVRHPGVYYDEDAVEGYVKFCERELTLTDGSELKLLDSFKLWAEQIFGWYYFITKSIYVPDENGGGHYEQVRELKRLINKQYIITARGAAKSMYMSTIQGYFLIIDPTTTNQITVAPTMAQANEVMSPLRTALLRSRGPWMRFLTEGSKFNTRGSVQNKAKVCSTKNGIENFMTGSLLEVKPMSVNKLQGGKCKVATIDEWLSVDTREDVTGAVEQSASKNMGSSENPDYIIIAASSEGTVRNGVGDTMKQELDSILRGEYYNPHVSIWHYKLDEIAEVGMPEMWLKANPNLGKTVSYETYQLDVERAEKMPSQRNDILAKRFGIPLTGFTYFFSYDEIKVHPRATFWQLPCSLGIDLSQGDDFCAFTFLFPLSDGRFGVKTRSYISSRTMSKLPSAVHDAYEGYMAEGSLIVLEGTVLDLTQVYDDLAQHIDENEYTVCCVGYDPYNAQSFINRWSIEHGPFGIEKVIQGAKTETVPLGELKMLASDRKLIFDEALMSFTMGNCIVEEDTNGNRKLHKKRRENKIDNVSALMDAYVAYKLNKGAFE